MTEFANVLPWISAIGVVVAIYMSLKSNKREDSKDTSQNAEKLTKISAVLDSVRDGVDDIRIEMRSQQKQINDLTERVVRVEESDKTTWVALSGGVIGESDEEPVSVNPHPEPAKNIARGAQNDFVKWIQWELVDAGISVGTTGIDGDFGKKTEAAVLKFQEVEFPKEPKEWDGIVGPKTRAKLKDVKGLILRDSDE